MICNVNSASLLLMITSLGCASEYLFLISFIDEITPEPLLIVV